MSEHLDGHGSPLQVQAQGVQLGYGRHTVLDGLELAVRRGEFWCLVGPNGAGKSTFVRAILGRGGVLGGQLDVHVPRERIGYVPQRCDLNPTLPTTVREFVSLGLVGTSARRRDRQRLLAWALERVLLAGRETQSYWALSGGQRQRALVARALVRQPELLLLDEPTTGLDLHAEYAVLESLARLHDNDGVTVMCVAHDLRLPARYATHVAMFSGGSVDAGRRRTVLKADAVRRAFGVDAVGAEIILPNLNGDRGGPDVP